MMLDSLWLAALRRLREQIKLVIVLRQLSRVSSGLVAQKNRKIENSGFRKWEKQETLY